MRNTPVAIALIAAVAALAYCSGAQAQQRRFYDARGNSVGTSTQSGNQTTFRDSRGNTTGTTTTDSQGTTVFRDSRGNVTGREFRR